MKNEVSLRLSKSRYLSGCQCPLKLWNDVHRRELAAVVTDAQQAIFDTGHRVGELACERYPEGVLIDAGYTEPELALRQTQDALSGGAEALFEAAFLHDNVLVRADILVRDSGAWRLEEVKSSTGVKEVHLGDVAVQHYVLEGAGLELASCGVVTLDTSYIFDGVSLDLDRLFAFHDLTETAGELRGEVEQNVAGFNELILQTEAPVVPPGAHCTQPYECPYLAHCTRDIEVAVFPVSEIPRLSARKRQELAELGIDDIRDIPEDFPLSVKQRIVRQATVDDDEFLAEGLSGELDRLVYPVFYLDFEAAQHPIPRHANTRAYQALPFQYSIHIENADGKVFHVEYLHQVSTDPRRELAQALIEHLGEHGTVCAYSSYEKTTIKALARDLPDLADDLNALLPRLWDLQAVLSRYYYHPGFHGSWSIKDVLPVLSPDLDYAELDIADGKAAARQYLAALDSDDDEFRQSVFSGLREYCGLDTLAMLRVKQELTTRIQAVHSD